MKRRNFIKAAGGAGLASLLPATAMSVWGAPKASFGGVFFLHLFADGAWDATSFCDPKADPLFNGWARTGKVLTAGNIPYAPIANNADFFTTHGKKTLVINGINTATNAHSVGRLYNYTGSQTSSMPGLAALYAYQNGQGLAMPVMTNAKVMTGGILAPTLINDGIMNLIDTNADAYNASNATLLPSEDLLSIRHLRVMQAEALKLNTDSLPRQKAQMNDYHAAVTADTAGFSQLGNIHSTLTDVTPKLSSEEKAVKFALSAFKSGLGVSASISLSGFDSHANHDVVAVAQFEKFTRIINAAWSYAEQVGLSDRLVVFVSSDFGREPSYNDHKGKDHWPITSNLIMKTGESWTNRVVGATTANYLQKKINPDTLAVDANGVAIEPKHVHDGLRKLLGLDGTLVADKFKLDAVEAVDWFNPSVSTVS